MNPILIALYPAVKPQSALDFGDIEDIVRLHKEEKNDEGG